ncbi:MAG: GNAT family N-acetyltransferase [Clostridia bacterium]|nr:GNAT family N-acetyltransferase [Clostridia bacterium]
MIELKNVQAEHRNLLWNIHQKYLYEMTNYYDDEMDDLGNYHYGYFDAYFAEPERKAFFIYDGQALVGFAMIHPYSYISEKPDYVLAEFTIFPMYRKKHLATEAARMIFNRYRGCWEIKYNEKIPAPRNCGIQLPHSINRERLA